MSANVSRKLSSEARALLQRQIEIDNEIEKRLCERDLVAFTKSAWHIIEPGTKLVWNWHLDTICGYLMAFHQGELPDKRLIINVPPGTLKSILVSVMYPAWTWIIQPELRYLSITNEQGLAIRDALRMKQVVTSDWFQRKWPLALQADQNEKTLYSNDKRGFRQSQGITASNTGKRGDCLIGETLVSTEIGDIRIDALCLMANAPKVWSFNHTTRSLELKEIVASKQSVSDKLIKVTALSCDIICTPEHRIFTGLAYEKAKDISGCAVSVLQWPDDVQAGKAGKVQELRSGNVNVHNVWKGFCKGWRRIRQAYPSWVKDWAILLKTVQHSCLQNNTVNSQLQTLRDRVHAISRPVKDILFGSLQRTCAKPKQNATKQVVRGLRNGDGNQQFSAKILFKRMCEQGAFKTDERGWEFAFPVNYGQERVIYKNATIDSRKRWARLRSLFGFQNDKRVVCSSYRLGCGEQYTRELDNSVRLLPYEGAQGSACAKVIAKAEPYQDDKGAVPVYDIQVEENHNFFANGILVHNCLLLDDPTDAKHAFSDVIRQGVNDTWDQSLSSRLNHLEESGVLLIMQRLHESDITGHLLKKVKSKWTVLSIPMRYEGHPTFDAGKDIGRPELNDPRTKKGELLFPKRFSEKAVQSLEEDLGEYGTSGQLQQRPSPLGGGIIKKHWWRVWPDDIALPLCLHIFHSWDTAFSERDMKDAAFSACTRWGIFFHEQRQKYCILALGMWFDRLGYDELRKKVKELDKEFRPDINLIEKKATGITLIQDLKRASPGRVRAYSPGRGEDKISRAHSVSPMLEGGLVYIPNKVWALGNNQDKSGLIDYVASFPTGAPPSADITDTVTQALIYLRAMNWTGELEDDHEEIIERYYGEEEIEDTQEEVVKYYA